MQEQEIRFQALDKLLFELQQDKAALESPAWDRIKQILAKREEILVTHIVNSEEENPRLKGRVQEIKSLLSILEDVEGGIANAANEIEEIEKFRVLVEMQEQAIEQGVD